MNQTILSKKFLVMTMLCVIVILCSSLALASQNKAAYIHHNMRTIDYNRISIMESMGYAVDIILDTEIGNYNLSTYDFLLVNDNYLSNPENVPVNDYPFIVMNFRYLDDWHLAKTSYSITSSKPLTTKATTTQHFITETMPENITIYTSCCDGSTNIPAFYLGRRADVATGFKYILETFNVYYAHGVIGTLSPGDTLRDGKVSNSKTVFFGIEESEFWTPLTQELFERSIIWLTRDETAPVISNVMTSATHNSANITFGSDDESNVTIKYGTTSGNLDMRYYDDEFNRQHNITLNNLVSETTYYANITLCNDEAYCKTYGPYPFTTALQPIPSSPNDLEIEVLVPSNNIRLSWTNPGGNPPIDHYNLYISNSPDLSSFNFASEDQELTTTEFTDTFASLHKERYYIVRSVDIYGIEEENNFRVGKYDLDLQSGPNFISFPLLLQGNSLGAAMHQDASYNPVNKVMKANPGNPDTFDIAVFSGSSWTGAFSTVANGIGYIFNSSIDTTFTTVGVLAIGEQQLQLNPGMNLVGFSTVKSYQLNNLLSQDPASYIVKEISTKTDSNNGDEFDIATFYPDNAPDYFYSGEGLDSIVPGRSYWIKAKSSGTVAYISAE